MEESKSLGRARARASQGQGKSFSPTAIPSLPYLGRDAPKLGVFAAVMGAVLVPLCEVLSTLIGVHLCHALLRLPTHQPTAGEVRDEPRGQLLPPARAEPHCVRPAGLARPGNGTSQPHWALPRLPHQRCVSTAPLEVCVHCLTRGVCPLSLAVLPRGGLRSLTQCRG